MQPFGAYATKGCIDAVEGRSRSASKYRSMSNRSHNVVAMPDDFVMFDHNETRLAADVAGGKAQGDARALGGLGA